MVEKVLEGKLFLHSEQGMEGGYLCFQEIGHISLSSIKSAYGIGENIKVWDKKNTNRQGITSNAEIFINEEWSSYYDPIQKDEDFKISCLYLGELKGDLEADKRLAKKYKFKIKYYIQRLNESYGVGKWRIDNCIPNIILSDGTKVHFGDSPNTIPQRPYGIPQDAKTRVSVEWNDGIFELKKMSDELLTEQWDHKGLNTLKNGDRLHILDNETKKIICEGQLDKIPLKIFSQTKKGHFEDCNNESNCNWEQYFSENYFAILYRE